MGQSTIATPVWLSIDALISLVFILALMGPLCGHQLVMLIGHHRTPPARHARQYGRRPLEQVMARG